MPQNQHKRAWLLLAASITLHIFILTSTRIVHNHAGARRGHPHLLLKRSGLEEGSPQALLFSLPYAEWYETSPTALRPFYLLFLVIILAFLFSFIGISASDFFCPNLSTIAAYLGLNESTAGVTFLAFGNGSPDVFSTFSAMKGGTFGLAIGELIGAASFIVSIVVGSIALIRPFHVPRTAFLRDVIFFTAAVILLIAVLKDGHLTLYESGGMVLLYVAYVVVVVLGNWLSRRRRRKAERESLLGRSPASPSSRRHQSDQRQPSEHHLPSPQNIVGTENQNVHTSSPDTLAPRTRPNGLTRSRSHTTASHLHSFAPHLHHHDSVDTPRANFSLLGAVEFRDVVNSLRLESPSRSPSLHGSPIVGPGIGGDYFGPIPVARAHRRSSSHVPGIPPSRSGQQTPRRPTSTGRRRASSHASELTPTRGQDRTVSAPLGQLGSSPEPNPWSDQAGKPGTPLSFPDDSLPLKPGRPRIVIPDVARNDVPTISVVDPSGAEGHLSEPPPVATPSPQPGHESRFAVRRHSKLILRVLFPSLQSFRHKSILGMVLAITSVPAVLALTLTLPVVDDGREGEEGGIALPVGENEGLDEHDGMSGFDLDCHSDGNRGDDDLLGLPEEDSEADRLLTPEIGEELHHLVDHGFSPFHSPLGRIHHSALRRASNHVEAGDVAMGGLDGEGEHSEEELNKEIYEEEESDEALSFNKYLTAVQCIFGPVFCTYVILGDMSYLRWVILGASLGGLAAAIAVVIYATDGTAHPWRLIRCFCGFICSMVWIAAIADQVVSVLNTVGEILGLSDAIIGLTIFAVGNSLADLVANVTVAQFAPAMAYAACFGGPMLNLLLGVGGSGTYHILTTLSHKPVKVDFSPTLWVSAGGLVAVLIATAIFVPLNGYLIDRRWAACLIVAYIVLMGVNVGVELKTGRA